MSNEKSSMGFISWLLLLFIGLKLTDYIDWSWWWVLSPIWIPLAIVFALWLILCVSIGLGVLYNKIRYR